MLVLRRGENRSTGKIPLGVEKRTNNKLNPLMTPSPGNEPGPHWWETSGLATAPSLLPQSSYFLSVSIFQITVKLLFACPTKPSPVQLKLIPRKGTAHPPCPLTLQKAHWHIRLPCPPPSAILAKTKMIHLHRPTPLPSAYSAKSPRKLLWGIILKGSLSFTVGFGSLLIASLEGLLHSRLQQRKGMFTPNLVYNSPPPPPPLFLLNLYYK